MKFPREQAQIVGKNLSKIHLWLYASGPKVKQK